LCDISRAEFESPPVAKSEPSSQRVEPRLDRASAACE
jgi:hypothetical protein